LKRDESQLVIKPDTQKRNFAKIKWKRSRGSNNNENEISPKDDFDFLKSTVDRALTAINHEFRYKRQIFRVTRHEFAPVTLKVVSINGQDFFEVDLVPAMYLNFNVLPRKIAEHVEKIVSKFNVNSYKSKFMAISLHKADKEKYELDFHDFERIILHGRGCKKKVIKLLKYLRDKMGGNYQKLWSHLLKTVVMHQVLVTPARYWKEENLPNCFIDCMKKLLKGLDSYVITDLFFPQVNLVDRIKKDEVIENIVKNIQRKINAYEEDGDILKIFPLI